MRIWQMSDRGGKHRKRHTNRRRLRLVHRYAHEPMRDDGIRRVGRSYRAVPEQEAEGEHQSYRRSRGYREEGSRWFLERHRRRRRPDNHRLGHLPNVYG